MPISKIGTNSIDQSAPQQIGGVSVGLGGGSAFANTAVGNGALNGTNTGGFTTAVGYQAGYSNTSGQNTMIGANSGQYITTGTRNTGVGVSTLGFNNGAVAITSNDNTAQGHAALTVLTSGAANTAIGSFALQANTTASNNTAVGYQAGYTNTTSSANTFVGAFSGYYTTGTANTFIGRGVSDGAGQNVTTGSKNTVIGGYNGNQGGLDIRTSNNYIVLSDGDGNPRQVFDSTGAAYFDYYVTANAGTRIYGPSTTGSPRIEVLHPSTTGSGGAYLAFSYAGGTVGSITQNGTTAVAYNTSSDYRLKDNIQPMTGALAKVSALKPCTYKWKSDGSDGEGFIAHELAEVCPNAVTGEKDAVDEDGNPIYQGIDTSFLVATLTAAIQELKADLDATKAELAALKGQP